MVVVLTFVVSTKKYSHKHMNKKLNYQRGEMDFLIMILLFVVVIFIIWVFTGGSQKSDSQDKPFIIPGDNTSAPLKVYGPGEKPN